MIQLQSYRLCRFSMNFSNVISSNKTKSWTPTSIWWAIFDVFSCFVVRSKSGRKLFESVVDILNLSNIWFTIPSSSKWFKIRNYMDLWCALISILVFRCLLSVSVVFDWAMIISKAPIKVTDTHSSSDFTESIELICKYNHRSNILFCAYWHNVCARWIPTKRYFTTKPNKKKLLIFCSM